MTHIFKKFVIFVLLTTAVGCGQNARTTQPIANPGQLDKRHDIPQPIAKSDQSDRKHDIQVSFSFDTENDQDNRISGFRLYKEGKLICEVKDPKSKSIVCDFTSPGGSFLFTMTTYFKDGSESPHSEPFSYTLPD